MGKIDVTPQQDAREKPTTLTMIFGEEGVKFLIGIRRMRMLLKWMRAMRGKDQNTLSKTKSQSLMRWSISALRSCKECFSLGN